MDQTRKTPAGREKDWNGPAWKHPYVLYLVLVVVLFMFLGLMAYLAIENDWIPKR